MSDPQSPFDAKKPVEQTGVLPSDGAAPLSLVRVGTGSAIFGPGELSSGMSLGSYSLHEKLGEGGMGSVFRATHVKLKKIMALKIFSAAAFSGDGARFEREMEAVGRLNHPNIVQAHDAGEVDGVYYIAMDLIEGRDLFRFVRKKGVLTVKNACRVVHSVALALHAAHKVGLVHRDIKPSNLLVDRSGKVYLTDLGLARLEDAGIELTKPGSFFGTPDYMAPEQWDDAHGVDARADLYALGCVLHFVLLGRAPYETEACRSIISKMKAHAMGPVPDLRTDTTQIPEGLRAIFRRLMEKSRDDRFQSAIELVKAIKPFTKDSLPPATKFETIPETVDSTLPAVESAYFVGTHAGEIRTLTSLKINFRWCPPGAFTMGNSILRSRQRQRERQVDVTLSRGYWVSESVITRGNWECLIQTCPWREIENVTTGREIPATNVSYADALAFCLALTEVERQSRRLPTTWSYALPTEAQWEYACRAGTQTRFSCGHADAELGEFGWHQKNSSDRTSPHMVGQKRPNPWGLKDMHGNVSEWCSDWYSEELCGGVDPMVNAGSMRVCRGGTWRDKSEVCESSSRRQVPANSREDDIGFRIILVCSPLKKDADVVDDSSKMSLAHKLKALEQQIESDDSGSSWFT